MNSISRKNIDLAEKKKLLLKQLLQKEAAAHRDTAPATRPAVSPRADRQSYPLSPIQLRLWKLEQFAPARALLTTLRLDGQVDLCALEQSVRDLAQRHEILRAIFLHQDGVAAQRILSLATVHLPQVDLSMLAPEEIVNALEGLLDLHQQEIFAVGSGPLFRTSLIRLSEKEHLFIFAIHPLLADNATLALLAQELLLLYREATTGHKANLPVCALTYADYAAWQQHYLQGAVLKELQHYWKQQLAGATLSLNLPLDHPRTALAMSLQQESTKILNTTLIQRVRAFCERENTDLESLCFATLALLLKRYSGQADMVIGRASTTRAPGLEDVAGPFTTTQPVRVQLDRQLSAQAFVQQIQKTLSAAERSQGLPLESIVEAVYPRHDLTREPLFQVSFAFQRLPSSADLSPDLLPLRPEHFLQDLAFIVQQGAEQLALSVFYESNLFDATSIERLHSHFVQLLTAFVEQPTQALETFSCLTASERTQILFTWNEATLAKSPPPSLCLHHLFEEQVARTPLAIALSDGGQSMTYAELNARANQLAHLLQRRGVGAEQFVGLCLSRSFDLLIGQLAILKAGAAYVPLDPSYPRDRLDFTIQDANLRVILTEQSLLANMPFSSEQALCLDIPDLYAQESTANLTLEMHHNQLAYVIYTSGSTGRPKGVCICHRNAVVFLLWARQEFSAEELAGVLFGTSICFDLSIFEVFAPLSWGGKVILANTVLDLPQLATRERITLLNTVPSAATALLNTGKLPSSLLTINLAGEALARNLVQALYQRTGVQRVCNLYGPTEDTTYSTGATIGVDEAGAVTIGRPLVNTQAYIVDAHMQPVPVGVAGELYLAGDGQARGYLKRPDLTAERFVPDPFSKTPGSRLYKTGDLARYRADGSIDYLGRLDHQVKVRGFRIELGEIEAHLRQHPAIADVVVVAQESAPGEKHLAAYFVARPLQSCDIAQLRQHLQDRVPAYMVPTFFIPLSSLPQTVNGKVDRKALPAPRAPRTPAGISARALPRETREQLLTTIWQEVLPGAEIQRADNFFKLGGDSWHATRLLSLIQRDLQIALSLDDIFAAPTIAQLAERLHKASVLEEPAPLSRQSEHVVSSDTPLPLLFTQKRFWFIDQLEGGSAQCNVPLVLALTGPLQTLPLYQALRELVQRHEMLRANISVVKGSPLQFIAGHSEPDFVVLDLIATLDRLRSLHAEELYCAPPVLAEIQREISRPFELANSSLLRARLLRLRIDHHILLLNMHQVITDSWSLTLLMEELSALYTAFSAGHPSPLPTLPARASEVAIWQREHQARHFAEDLAYWKEYFSPLPPALNIPCDYPRPVVRSSVGHTKHFQLSQELSQQLLAQSQQEGVTLFTTLLTAFLVLLACYSKQEDIVVGTAVANRTHPDLDPLVGCFANILALRADLSGNPTGRVLLHRVATLVQDAYSHQEVPFEEILKAVQIPRDPSRTPLFQVSFLLQKAPAASLSLPDLSVEPVEIAPPVSQSDLSFTLEEDPSGLRLKIEYSTQLFAEKTIERFQAHYQFLLAALCEQPDTYIQEFPLVTPEEEHERIYWTGEIARQHKDETMEEQTKASSKQIEPSEIEETLRSQAGVQEAVVLHREGEGQANFAHLNAYVQFSAGARADISLLRLALKKRFASTLPMTIQVLDAFPLTENGEIDRSQLLRPQQGTAIEQASPRATLEYTLTRIWQNVLKLPLLERTENFFEIGGHSLLAMQVLAAIREELHIAISTRQFFAAPTLAELADLIEATLNENGQKADKDSFPPLVAVERTGDLPLSFAQQRLWFLDQLEGSSATYNIPIVLRLTGELNLPVLQSSVREIVRRHEALRTTFPKGQQTPVQCIHLLPLAPVELVDLTNEQPENLQAALVQDIQAEIQRPFDLAVGPLLRTRVLRLNAREHIIIFVMHHIISDGWSMSVLAQELNALYNAFSAGQPSPLPELAIQYGDFVVWQRHYLQGERLNASLDYWRTQLSGATILKLPTDHPRAVAYSSPGARCSTQWEQTFAQQLQAFSQQEDVTLFMTLLAAFQMLLACYSGQDDITVGSPVANRSHPALEPLVGFFVNTLALRINLAGNPTVREVLQRVRDITLGAYDHQDIPFEQVVEAVQPERQPGIPPLFQVFFVLQNNTTTELALTNLQASSIEMHTATAKFDIALSLESNSSGLDLSMEYNTRLFERSTIQQMQESYRLLLAQCVANPETRLADLSGNIARKTEERLVISNVHRTE